MMYIDKDQDHPLASVIDDLYDRLERQERALYFLLAKAGKLSENEETLFLDLLTGHSTRNVYFEHEEKGKEE